jgi:mono/diheme cytochrome c family protein
MSTMPARARAALVAAAMAVSLAGAACGGDDDGATDGPVEDGASAGVGAGPDADLALGETVYAENCAECHGEDLRGTDRGPSPLSEVYEPGHHPDASFAAAIAQGSPQHHWEFGDMPPVEGLDEAETAAVIAYVRSVQEAEGLEPYPPG